MTRRSPEPQPQGQPPPPLQFSMSDLVDRATPADTVGPLDTISEHTGPEATLIDDWDDAVESGWYRGQGAANGPSAVFNGWWMGWTIAHNDRWCTQFAVPYSQDGIDAPLHMRQLRKAQWTNWWRLGNYPMSSGTQDNLLFHRHGGDSGDAAGSSVTLFATGVKKSDASAAPHPDDEWRVQCYDVAGQYTGRAMAAGRDGRVVFPSGHALLDAAARAGQEVPADTAATVGAVQAMIDAALVAAGVHAAAASAGLRIGPPTSDRSQP